MGEFEARPTQPRFKAELVSWQGVPVKDTWVERTHAVTAETRCKQALFRVSSLVSDEKSEKAPPPFITSRLQMAASVALGMSPKSTMESLQRLFEEGHITYHRTDSPYVVPDVVAATRQWISEQLPKEYLPPTPNVHAAKDGAQEAHEAIRPTHWETGHAAVTGPDAPVYNLIWRRFIASQLAPCRNQHTILTLSATDRGGSPPEPFALFEARGKVRLFDGWRRIADMAEVEKPEGTDEGERLLPNMQQGDPATVLTMAVHEKASRPPERYSQARLIDALEKNGIGRPSSYATILETIIGNNYVREEKKKLFAEDIGCRITDFLVEKFAGDFIELPFTKRTEESLDLIAAGKLVWQPYLSA